MARIVLVHGVVHALFDDGVTEGHVLLRRHPVEVQVAVRVRGQLEALQEGIELRSDEELKRVILELFKRSQEEGQEVVFKDKLSW